MSLRFLRPKIPKRTLTCSAHASLIQSIWVWKFHKLNSREAVDVHGYIPERVVNSVPLKRNFKDINNKIIAMGWKKVYDQSGSANIDRVLELYANFDQQRYLKIEYLAIAIQKQWTNYKDIREMLCVLISKAKWSRYDGKYQRHKCLRMSNFYREELAHPLENVFDPIDSMVDISKVMAPRQSEKHNLTPTEERAGQSTLLSQMQKMLVIHGEHMRLDYSSVYVDAPHTVYSKALLGEDANLPDDEDVCSVDLMHAD
ncbi:hypothetical protein RND71_018539 [Anisodus tanguticus]|uniref:Uncharacterized protein n=1 Tax=Anisodus tanguticus TaxID=243964 RepID=A0AAE1S4D0_9SOLA|nr:hypothetical protein RND71_018539 [Anisodus tanguticus]